MKKNSDLDIFLGDSSSIGELIKTYRKEKKITQEELASFAGLSRVGVVKIEKNESDIKLSTLIKIISLLGFDLILKRRTTK